MAIKKFSIENFKRFETPYISTDKFSPSKARIFTESFTDFIERYFLKKKIKETDAMTKGKIIHEIFRRVVKDEEVLFLDVNLTTLKGKEALKIAQENETALLLDMSFQPIYEKIKLELELRTNYKRVFQDSIFEAKMEDEKTQGILDIYNKKLNWIFDIKTTGLGTEAKEFFRWNEENLLMQAGAYSLLYKKKYEKTERPFFCFLVLGTNGFLNFNLVDVMDLHLEYGEALFLKALKDYEIVIEKMTKSFGHNPVKTDLLKEGVVKSELEYKKEIHKLFPEKFTPQSSIVSDYKISEWEILLGYSK